MERGYNHGWKKKWERLAKLMNHMGVLTEVDMATFAAYCLIVSLTQDGRKPRNISLPVAQPLKLIKDISSRHPGLELQNRFQTVPKDPCTLNKSPVPYGKSATRGEEKMAKKTKNDLGRTPGRIYPMGLSVFEK